MLLDTIINQLDTLKGNIEYADIDELTQVLEKLSQDRLQVVESWIHSLNDLLIDGHCRA